MAKRIVPASMSAFYEQFHFAPAVVDGDHVRCSGQLGHRADGTMVEEPEAQFVQAFENVKMILEEAGVSMDNIIEMTTFHVGLNEHLPTFLGVKDKYVKDPYPAWTAIGISELALPGALVEIRVTARR
jgi:enamine deaminase RidA (YjgF/YER057c/UK114 family)